MGTGSCGSWPNIFLVQPCRAHVPTLLGILQSAFHSTDQTVERMAARPGGFIAKAKRRAQDLNERQMVGEHEYWGSKGVGGARRSQQRREQVQRTTCQSVSAQATIGCLNTNLMRTLLQTNKKRQSRPIVMQALEKFDYNKSNGLNFQQLVHRVSCCWAEWLPCSPCWCLLVFACMYGRVFSWYILSIFSVECPMSDLHRPTSSST